MINYEAYWPLGRLCSLGKRLGGLKRAWGTPEKTVAGIFTVNHYTLLPALQKKP